MMAVEDEIAMLAEDIKRWAGQDARIHDALDQLLKLYEAEVNALAFEAIELQRLRDADKAVNWELTPAREAVIDRAIAEPPPRRPWGSWGRQAGAMDDGDWRNSGIA